MARGAVGKFLGRAKVRLLNDGLVLDFAARFPVQIKDFAPGAYRPLRMSMAFGTPSHLEGFLFPCDRHLIHGAVATDTPDSLLNVDAMVEIHEVGQLMDSTPADRRIGSQTLTNRLQQRRFRPDLRMTSHAGLGRRHPSERRFFDRGMTIPAINSKACNVVLMAEGYRLIDRYPNLRRIG